MIILPESVSKFAAVATIGFLLNAFFMWLGVDLLHTHYLVAQIITTGLVLIWSFLGNRFWTFSDRQSGDPDAIN